MLLLARVALHNSTMIERGLSMMQVMKKATAPFIGKLTVEVVVAALGMLSVTAHAATKPTVLFVHGAFADGSSWNKVIPRLEQEGIPAVSVQNPLTSLKDDVATTERAIAGVKGPVVLVGHSWAGMVITQAGMNSKVKGLVYVAAFAPDKGQSIKDIEKGMPRCVTPARCSRLGPIV